MMRLILSSTFALLLAMPAAAQANNVNVQLRVWTNSPEQPLTRVPLNTTVIVETRFRSSGPFAGQAEIVIEIPGRVVQIEPAANSNDVLSCSPAGVHPVRCTLSVPQPHAVEGWIAVTAVLDRPGLQTAVASIGSRRATSTVDVVALPSVSVFVAPQSFISRINPGETVRYNAWISSGYGVAATNVRATYTLPAGGTFLAARPPDAETQCSVTPDEVVCTRATLPPNTNVRVELDVAAPERLTGGTVVLYVTSTHDGTDFNPADDTHDSVITLARRLVVSNTNDEGSGSLRQALLESHTFCEVTACTIAFDIPGTPENGAFEIRPKSPLPEVRGMVTIAGATQPGARIVLNGAEAGAAHGLLLGRGCEIQVLDLTITGFLWPGVEAHRGQYPENCPPIFSLAIHPNTLIARNTITGNYRGVVLVDSGEVTVRDNVITENRRSGLFVDRGHFVEVMGNRVERNGASGMFFNIGTRGTYPTTGALVTGNVISGNSEWGITRTNAGEIHIHRNSIFGNQHPAIDLNLDFATPNRAQDNIESIPNEPLLLSAFYDPVQGATVVTLRVDTISGYSLDLDFYANDPAGVAPHWQAETWVAMQFLDPQDVNKVITISLPHNLQGKYLVATNTRRRFASFAKPPDVTSHSHARYTAWDTSELSNAVLVK
ncbi:MAG TPA: right-handed parallel beta-helix repeat-containing protein [Thermoanaerobaculia bacterium]|jgi:parallel beta-helix repeat protein